MILLTMIINDNDANDNLKFKRVGDDEDHEDGVEKKYTL